MLLLRLVKVDFSLVFNQGFRLLLVMNTLLCYVLLLLFHALLLQPMYHICGTGQFSVITRWMLWRPPDNNFAKDSNAIVVACYMTNVTDMCVMSFGLLFVALFMCECCLQHRKRRKIEALMKNRRSALDKDEITGEDRLDRKVLRQRLSNRSSTTRFISRLAMLLPASILATVHLVCAITTFLMFHFIQQSLDKTGSGSGTESEKTAMLVYMEKIELVKWRLLIYLILSCFLCGFYWSMSGIDMSMLKAIYARSRRQDQFRRMNASVFTEGNII